ncbi:MAG: gfo/Idh/MocA family oxidoreductase [Paenibacillaceae bacterium]|jgi:predicted dehydrogenase|nr:gfo/Idh/MocA family oxidoreductase [Paenibacillaceae bacterium]
MKTWRIGLVGTGFWSEKHLKAWARVPNARVVSLCNRSREKLAVRGREFGIDDGHLYDDLDRMLAEEDLDILDIVTGPETHLPFVEKAAAAGKHIMCQKPFAPSMEQAQLMVETADRAGVRLMVTENWRWLEPFRIIKGILEAGTLGKVRVARYIHTDYYTPRMSPGTAIPQPFFREMPKLLFYEMGAHWFDTWRFLFGTPKRLYAETATISPHIRGEDSGIVALGYDDFYGYMDMSWATRQKLDRSLGDQVSAVHLEQMVIDGEAGTLKLYTDGKITLISRDGGTESVVAATTELDHEESHYRLQSHFIQCLDTGEPFQTSGADNLVTLEMIFGTYRSAQEHAPVGIGAEFQQSSKTP